MVRPQLRLLVRLPARSLAIVAWWALLASACFPSPLDVTGKRCDEARPCGDGFVCFDGVCFLEGEVDAGPANWLVNGDFEDWLPDGGCPGWTVKPGRLTREAQAPHRGLFAARLWGQRGDGGNTPAVFPSLPVVQPKAGQTWCAEAWVRTVPSEAGFAVQLNIRETLDGGAVVGPTARGRTIGRDWERMENAYTPTADGVSLDVRLVFGTAPTNSVDAIIIDDVTLRRSPDDTCRWP